jgi:hypothetical protein
MLTPEGIIYLFFCVAQPSLTITQVIFTVLFSILYGVMLQSLSRLQPFPFERVRIGFVDRNEDNDLWVDGFKGIFLRWDKKGFSECLWEFESEIVREKNHKHRQEKKDRGLSGWLLCMWRARIVCSIILLNVLPALYFLFVLIALGKMVTIQEMVYYFGIIFWAALGVFGFYRGYHALICWSWRNLFCDVAKGLQQDSDSNYLTSSDGWANFVWALIYLVPPIVLLISFVANLIWWGISGVCIFLIVALWFLFLKRH